jgi:cation diffusion facilitator family transporter
MAEQIGAIPRALPMASPTASRRPEQVRAALRLEYLTVGWNVLEGAVALVAAMLAGSIALLGFGVDSLVETASGGILIWRLWAERRNADLEAVEAVEHRAQKLVAASLVLLAVFIAFDAGRSLLQQEEPSASPLGIGLTAVSLVAMGWLARAKRQAGRRLNSRALVADAGQTQACFYLSAIVLVGLAANAVFGWWWADPLAAFGVIPFLAYEAREAWLGRDCC